MPKRSNLFQRLITILHERLDSSWNVTESKMFLDSLTGEEREVDIVLESNLGSHKIVLSIECRDQKRKADTPWVESMAKKHESLPTSKLVLWSASGFYEPAIRKAGKLNIDTVTSGNIESLQWAVLANKLKSGSVTVLNADLTFFIDVKTPSGAKARFEKDIDYIFQEIESEKCFSILAIKNSIASNPDVGSVLLGHATEDKSDFWIQYTHPVKCMVQGENQEWYEPFRIGFGVKTLIEKTDLETKSVLYENKVSTIAVGQLVEGTIEFFIEEKDKKNPKVSSKLIKKANKKIQRTV